MELFLTRQKRVLFYTTTEAISKNPKSNQLVESGHSDIPFEAQAPQNQTYFEIILT